MAESTSKVPDGVSRTERAKGAADGTPLHVDSFAGKAPGPDVSNADVNLAAVSLDSRDSKTVKAADQNPLDLRPAPGPSSVEVLGTPGS